MNQISIISKRITVYVVGLFLLALGATFSILAGIGVSPVTSLPYALALISPLSVGIATVVTNFVFIIIQVILLKKIHWTSFFLQLIIAFLFGSFMDLTIWLTASLPAANSLLFIGVYLMSSLFIISFGLFFYFTAGLPTMPYDSLTHVIASKWAISFGKAKITSDMLNVIISLALCFIFIRSFGAIGIGTFIAAYAIGKIVNKLLLKLQPPLKRWVFHTS